MVMRSLVGAFCGPRTLSNLARSLAGKPENRRAVFKSRAVSSRTSPSLSVSGFRFGINLGLPCIGFPQADDPHPVATEYITKDMKPVVEMAQRNTTKLAVVMALIAPVKRSDEIKVGNALERQPALADVLGILRGVELNVHESDRMYTKAASQM
jgi:hypothetical protein